MFRKMLLVLLFIHLVSSLLFDNYRSEENIDSSKVIKTFEELDQIMSHSEFQEVWKKVRNNIQNGEMAPELEDEFENIRPEELKENDENYDDDIDYDIILGSSSDSCLLSKEETTKILEKDYGIIDNDPKEQIRFIVGKCHPVILVPGMTSTKLQVRINCANLYSEEKEIFKKMVFFCGRSICASIEKDPYEEHDLFVSATGVFQLLTLGGMNKYSACLGYFLSFFNTKNDCSPDVDEGHDKNVCNYSKNIKIGYYGITKYSKNKGKCGLAAMQNLVMFREMQHFERTINNGIKKYYEPLIQKLEEKGYKAGFSLGGIPNDYRRFLANNIFTTNTIRYQIENLYKNTGKSVVVVAHSYGTLAMWNNLIKEENSDILPKIKKFIAIGPPFAGASALVKRFFEADKFRSSFTFGGRTLIAELNKFGWGLMINTLPITMELRPLPIIGSLLNDPKYKEFGDAIKERLYLEKECGNRLCDDETIKKYSVKFDSIFKGYFPSLTEPVCKYERNLSQRTDYFERKCITEMYNVADCPILIEAKKDASGNLPNDFESYCGKSDDNLYYQQDCNNNGRKCLDESFSTKLFYPFEDNEQIQFFIDNWTKENYKTKYGELDGIELFPSRDKYLSGPRKQIEFYNEISLTKNLARPGVDTDIVYSNFAETEVAYIYNENDFTSGGRRYEKGGDGTVPNWSPIITGLKWIYETKKYNLKNNIRLIEFCSRLGKDSEYAYDPKKDQKFAALSCNCIDKNNNYHNSNSCYHNYMITDPYAYEYISSIIDDPKEEIIATEDKIKAVKLFDNNIDYETTCNEKLLDIFDSEA